MSERDKVGEGVRRNADRLYIAGCLATDTPQEHTARSKPHSAITYGITTDTIYLPSGIMAQ